MQKPSFCSVYQTLEILWVLNCSAHAMDSWNEHEHKSSAVTKKSSTSPKREEITLKKSHRLAIFVPKASSQHRRLQRP